MKKKNRVLMSLSPLVLASVATGTLLDGGWRVNVGAAYNAPAKVWLKFAPMKFAGGNVMPTISGSTRAEALASVNKNNAFDPKTGRYDPNAGRIEYNGGKVFYDPSDISSKDRGRLEDCSWNVRVLDSTWNGESFVMASAEYVEVETVRDGQGRLKLCGEDETAMPGINVELSRNLYHNEEWNFGVDLSFIFSYFFRSDLYESGSCYSSDSTVVRRGKYETTVSPKYPYEEGLVDGEGYYGQEGTGTYAGLGTVFKDPILSDMNLSTTTYRGYGAFHAEGDYRDLEMILALRPYYDVAEWFRLYATIGVAVSRGEFDLDIWGSRNGQSYRYSREYSQWDVYGIGGLGAMLRWHDFSLGFDFFARFLDREIEIEDELVNGSLRRGRWMLRAFLGYEF